ncbi:hypothetical protein BD410DRAFT_837477 [Rickenella mellea]|uniref:Mannosyltransferase n=1 Tax=Rickenella mellea TaxID=50990 RepID=A0A4Y7QD37_9AGAM|nr:hypothetical protein BD410DRAFT_837477 [Rickenella mellea]
MVAGDFLGVYDNRPWEYDPAFPCRSPLIPWLTSGPPLLTINALLFVIRSTIGLKIPLGFATFVATRLSYFFYSFIGDSVIRDLSRALGPAEAIASSNRGWLYASSYITLAYAMRPFSNTLELHLVMVLIWTIFGYQSPKSSIQKTIVIACLLAFGAFARITFVLLGLPFALFHFATIGRSFPKHVAAFSLAGILTSIAIITFDSLYMGHFVITPLNFLRYNSDPANLALHGMHPRWLHAMVNLPLLFGPLLVATIFNLFSSGQWRSLKPIKSHSMTMNLRRTCTASFVLTLAALSAVPHQEPRFLIPLFPLLLFMAPSIPRGKIFAVSWIGFNFALLFIYGVVHQGGIAPTSLWIERNAKGGARFLGADSLGVDRDHETPSDVFHSDVLFWRSYSVPSALFSVPDPGFPSVNISVTNVYPSDTPDSISFLKIIDAAHYPSLPSLNGIASPNAPTSLKFASEVALAYSYAPRSTGSDVYSRTLIVMPLTSVDEHLARRTRRIWRYCGHVALERLDDWKEWVAGGGRRWEGACLGVYVLVDG